MAGPRQRALESFHDARGAHVAETKTRIVELRRQRIPWAEISKAVGIHETQCRRHYRKALAEAPVAHVDEHRAEELLLVDDATADLMILAKDDNISPRTRIEAWSTVRAWAERKAKLLGLDAPTQVVRIDNIDKEIKALTEELAKLEADIAEHPADLDGEFEEIDDAEIVEDETSTPPA